MIQNNEGHSIVMGFLAFGSCLVIPILLACLMNPKRLLPLTLLTKQLRRRVPRLCAEHARVVLRPGRMAILDSKNCEMCNGKVLPFKRA